jgi:hypothetical protein
VARLKLYADDSQKTKLVFHALPPIVDSLVVPVGRYACSLAADKAIHNATQQAGVYISGLTCSIHGRVSQKLEPTFPR